MSCERICYATILLGVHMIAAGCSSEEPKTDRTVTSAATQDAASSQPQADGKLVLAFGDSLYAGYGLAADQSFAAALEQALRGRGVAANVHNAGVSGDTSAAGRQRLRFTLDGLPRKPDLALVGLGGNDMLRGLDPAETEANLLAICEELRGRGIEVLLTGMLAAPNLGPDYVQRFNSLFPRVAKTCGAELYPFFLQGVIGNPSLMLPDRVHPNASGVQRIVDKVAPQVARELQKQD